MRTCASCGTGDQADGAAFCFQCGNALAEDHVCVSCGEELRPEAQFCPTCGSAQVGDTGTVQVRPTPTRSAARKITSVLFGDLVGFTTLSESRDAEEVRELLTAYFEECRAVVGQYGGELEKFIGDAVMAVWGLPVTREDDAERAVRAGLELVERVQALGDRIGMPGLNMRVGITTAEVAVTLGATGQGMVAGDPVNTAARIQSTASPGEVWVDETTRAFASSTIAFDDVGLHQMKGKAEPVQLFAVRAVVANVGGGRRDDGLEGQFVARDREIRLVKELFHQVQETARPGLVILDGDPGVGKSRLDWEFEKYVDGLGASVMWHRGRCLSYGEGVAFYALAESVRSRLSLLVGADDSDKEDGRQMLRRGLAACVADASDRVWLEPRLAVLLGLEPGSTFQREDLFVAWTAFFKYVGLWQVEDPQPVVLVIDDAQYADDGLLAYFEHLLNAADFPVFVLVLARPELLNARPTLVGNRRITVLHVEPLSNADMALLLDKLIVGMPDSIRDELVNRAEGIPLYAIETVRSLVDQDLVVPRNGRYELVDPSALDVAALTAPASLQALIAARLDTLPPDERLVVDRASVLGQVFAADGIVALCDDVANLEEALSALIRREVLRREADRFSADFGDYRFVQSGVRQVAYGMLSRRDRKATHLKVARAFEAELESRGGTGELAPVVAQHYLDAIDAVPGDDDVSVLTQKASDHLERAAARAADLGAPAEAAAHLAKALTHCSDERRLPIRSKLAHQLRVSGNYGEALEQATTALAGFEASGDVIATATVAVDLAMSLIHDRGSTDLKRAESVVREQLRRIADQPQTLPVRFDLVTTLATLAIRRGDVEEAATLSRQCVQLAELSGDPHQIVNSWIGYALSALDSAMPQLGVALLEQVVEVASEHRALPQRARALYNLSGYDTWVDLPHGIRYGGDAVAAARELGDGFITSMSSLNLGLALFIAGRWEEFLELAGSTDLGPMQLFWDANMRVVQIALGGEWPAGHGPAQVPDPDRLEVPAQLAHAVSQALEAWRVGAPDPVEIAMAGIRAGFVEIPGSDEFFLGWVLAGDLARWNRDHAALAELVGMVADGNYPWPEGIRAQRRRLEAYLGEGGSLEPEAVDSAYRDAIARSVAWGSALYEAHARADHGAWLVRQGRKDEGADQLDRARETYSRLGAATWVRQLEEEEVAST